MRWILIAPLAVSALYAQTPVEAPDKTQAVEAAPQAGESKPQVAAPLLPGQRKQNLERFKGKFTPRPIVVVPKGDITAAAGGPCAIPLKNVLPEAAAKKDEKIIIPVPTDAPDRYSMKVFSPPAPSCDDVKR